MSDSKASPTAGTKVSFWIAVLYTAFNASLSAPHIVNKWRVFWGAGGNRRMAAVEVAFLVLFVLLWYFLEHRKMNRQIDVCPDLANEFLAADYRRLLVLVLTLGLVPLLARLV